MHPSSTIKDTNLIIHNRPESPMADLPVLSSKLNPISSPSWTLSISNRPLLRRRVICPSFQRSKEPWGSNAETVRRGKFKFSDQKGSNERVKEEAGEERESWKRKWWSEDEDDDFLDDENDQPWDNIWIFKMFKAYGYLLPAIIASLLLASGPKAFLMALALPLGQSAISFAIDKIYGTRGYAGGAQRQRRRPRRQQRWPRRQNSPPPEPPPKRKASSFSTFRRPAEEKSAAGEGSDYAGWDKFYPTQATPMPLEERKGKLSKRERGGEVPLLLRLVISVFPFLGSWMRIL